MREARKQTTAHRCSGARKPGDQGNCLCYADSKRRFWRQRCRKTCIILKSRTVSAAPKHFGAQQHQPIEDQDDGNQLCVSKELLKRLLQDKADNPGRDRADHDVPAKARIGVVRVQSPLTN